MSHHAYQASKELMTKDWEFSALIMAAMKKADYLNTVLLRSIYPRIWAELVQRYNAPGGYIGDEVPPEEGNYSDFIKGDGKV